MIAALEIAAQTPPGPKLVRVEEKWTKSVAGMTVTERGGHEVRANLRTAWQTAAAQGPLWLAGWRSYRGYWWGDRAAAIARQLTPQGNVQLIWGSIPQGWEHMTRMTPRDAGEQCPICFEDYEDPFPRPPRTQMVTRGLDTVVECERHATCVDCDMDLQRDARWRQLRCPMCRAGRTHRTQDVPT